MIATGNMKSCLALISWSFFSINSVRQWVSFLYTHEKTSLGISIAYNSRLSKNLMKLEKTYHSIKIGPLWIHMQIGLKSYQIANYQLTYTDPQLPEDRISNQFEYDSTDTACWGKNYYCLKGASKIPSKSIFGHQHKLILGQNFQICCRIHYTKFFLKSNYW